jgi:secreted PhoX family phosphatase
MTANSPLDIHQLIEQRLDRRRLLALGSGIAAAGIFPACTRSVPVPADARFNPIAPNGGDDVLVPSGYRAETIVRWGDPLFSDVPALDAHAVADGALLRPGAAEAQARQFGYNCDGIGIFTRSDERIVMCVNNEFPSASLMFPGWRTALRERRLAQYVADNPECVAVMQAAVGVSVIELVRDGERWRVVVDSQYNRRITAHTEMEFSGPAARHALLDAPLGSAALSMGTFNNCAAGVTPWGTYLTAEENIQDYFGNGEPAQFGAKARRFHERFGYRRRGSSYGWEHADPRFDLRVNPNEPFRFGWIVEIDPLDSRARPLKRTALGRFRHEAATTVVAPDGTVAVYMGDDQSFEYCYKFVSNGRFVADDPAANRSLLDDGTLYVARLDSDGSGTWLPLVWSASGALSPANGFDSQADVVMNCRGAADLLQATPLDRPEDVAVDRATGRVYLACTQNLDRGAAPRAMAAQRGIDTRVDAANPRAENRAGHILEFREASADAAAERFTWEVLVVAGAVQPGRLVALTDAPMPSDAVYFGGITDPSGLSSFANPDNLAVDSRSNLWIVTDGTQPVGNNGCFVCALDGPMRGAVRQFMEGPVGAEICGCEFTVDESTLFLAVQHPGSGGDLSNPVSDWPDGGGAAPRPSLVAIQPVTAGVRVGEI